MSWYYDIEADTEAPDWLKPPSNGATHRPSVQCSCGRFARYRGVTHGYNGNYATETMTVDCSRCGVVDIELV